MEKVLKKQCVLKNMAEICVGTIDDIPEGQSKIIQTGGKDIAIFNISGDFFAITNACPHQGGPLGEGFLKDCIVTCPLHNYSFDVTSGQCTINPAMKVQTFDIEVRGEEIILFT